MSGILEYSSNNSGGDFWLKDEDWHALEAAGWVVHWRHAADASDHTHSANDPGFFEHYHAYSEPLLRSTPDENHRWLDALATSAAIETDNPNEAIKQFERLAHQSVNDEGCSCCGPPHSFSYTKDGKTSYLDLYPYGHSIDWR